MNSEMQPVARVILYLLRRARGEWFPWGRKSMISDDSCWGRAIVLARDAEREGT